MCTIVTPETLPFRLPYDIVVYKIAKLDDNNHIRGFFFDTPIVDLHEVMLATLTKSFPKRVDDCDVFSAEEYDTYVTTTKSQVAIEICGGFHSFRTYLRCLDTAKRVHNNYGHAYNTIVCECTIPKGSHIIDGYIDNVVSDRIIYNKILDCVYIN